MAFALKPGAAMPDEIRRAAKERVDEALKQLEALDNNDHEAIEQAVHDVRKRCKTVRALARLIREPIGEEYDQFNDLVRAAANELSSIRDAHAVLATFDNLYAIRSAEEGTSLDVVRSKQAALAADATRSIQAGDPRIRSAHDLLMAANSRVAYWQIPDDVAVLSSGFEETFGRGRVGLRRARKRPTDHRLHDWRKAVKTLWYQIRLVENAAPSMLTSFIAQLDDLSEALGDDHDLSVLIDRLHSDPKGYGGKKKTKRAIRIARAQQEELRGRAFRLGATLYSEQAVAFAERIVGYWQVAVREGPELVTGGIADLLADDQRSEPPTGVSGVPPERSLERERKFLIAKLPLLSDAGVGLRQGYISIDGTVAVRVRDAGVGACTLTVKAGRGAVRTELEWVISREQFDTLWRHTGDRRISKTRYRLPFAADETNVAGMIEIDVFHDQLDGLIVAEVEFASDETMVAFRPPSWFGREVTDDPAFSNASLALLHAPPSQPAKAS